ncbi:hypothetical protein P153DRAFT_361336 [Dothidotthia symphoricarpi CBS 119687]|uniref:Rhodopsin domain-containing protein n=1 Tax=Dothidotthia symphoricarpi CBS 119687 TaxID=1392245 RepID=A0A6A5ZX85_9PLEO|nr:uncharacterized protein P153DRAFT_361336 [Dothidotthia symphoricarpi CBS 119687]KAF2124149.1 hypothetical protein P153DRAFT_361336 [Dothidotthia symphoricarpi CBS 119687]
MFSDHGWISQDALLRTDYAMVSLTSTIFVARTGIQVWRRRRIEWQDAWLYVAYVAYIVFSVLYIVITPTIFKLEHHRKGEPVRWEGMEKDIKFMSRVLWSSGMEFWTCLWFIKFALLALYKKLLLGLPMIYLWVWRGTVVFCILTYITCIITGPVIGCESLKKYFERNECFTPTDVRHQTASLYYAYAIDTVTNFMVMFLPIRLIWNLQMARVQKVCIGLLFASGLICILFATIRVVQIGIRDGKPMTPEPKWLTLWTIIECSTGTATPPILRCFCSIASLVTNVSKAVIIGCCPQFATLTRKKKNDTSDAYNVQGYIRQSTSRPTTQGRDDVGLKSMITSGVHGKAADEAYWEDAHSSQEELARSQEIRVTTTFQLDNERRSGKFRV